MPDNIYPINVGQVEVPSTGGFGRQQGFSRGADNSLNSLLRFQQKMAEMEQMKQIQAQKNANELFGKAADMNKFGKDNQAKTLGFVPSNKYEANFATDAENQLSSATQAFANSDQSNASYAAYLKDVHRILNNPDLAVIMSTNAAVGRASDMVKSGKNEIHPIWYDQYNKYINASGPGDYRLDILANPDRYKVDKVDPNKDIQDMANSGLGFRIAELGGKNVLVGTQHNLSQVTDFVKGKYSKNWNMDFDLIEANKDTDPQYGQLVSQAGSEEAARKQYINNKADQYANSIATNTETAKYIQDLGVTDAQRAKIAQEEIAKKKAEGENETTEKLKVLKQQHSDKESEEAQRKATQLAIQEGKKSVAEVTANSIIYNADSNLNNKRKEDGLNPLSKQELIILKSKINGTGLDENTVVSEMDKENRSYSLKPSQSTKESVFNEIKQGDFNYNVIGNRGPDSKHSFKQEATSKSNLDVWPPQWGTHDVSQTVLEGITDIKVRDVKRIAVGTIITKNPERASSIPEYYKNNGFSGDKLSKQEIKELNKKGYNLDESEDEKYFRVPVEIELGAAVAPKNERDFIKRYEMGKEGYLSKNPDPKSTAKGAYGFIDDTGLEMAHRIPEYKNMTKEEYLQKMASGDEKFQDQLYDQWSANTHEFVDDAQSYLSNNKDKYKELLDFINNEVLKDGRKIDRIPNTILAYLHHHNGQGDGERFYKLNNPKSIAGFGELATAINKIVADYGSSDIDLLGDGDSSPATSSTSAPTPASNLTPASAGTSSQDSTFMDILKNK